MKPKSFKIAVILFCLSVLLLFTRPAALFTAAPPPEVPVKGMVTMVDLGAKKCIPRKMMAPILEKLEKAYSGRAAVVIGLLGIYFIGRPFLIG